VRWLDHLPDQISGVVLANELLDALPVRLFVADRGGSWSVGWVYQAVSGPGAPQAKTRLSGPIERRPGIHASGQAGDQSGWEIAEARDYLSEWPEQAIGWAATVAERIQHGALLLIEEYWFPAVQSSITQHATPAACMCHAKHGSHPTHYSTLVSAISPLMWITVRSRRLSSVPACNAPATPVKPGFCSIVRLARQTERPATRRPARTQRRIATVQLLLSEAEMGELFKVIAFTRGMPETAPLGFHQVTRSMSLERRSREDPLDDA
jgi:SAM-dependent MidA family methyltransferase